MLQPATKALAQVLAGRAGASGQLGHARSMLAQAERMIAERAHNRLSPAEREEFFEQLARLKLTLADADAEAEVQAGEQQEPRPAAPPIAQERLKEMALALSVRERPSTSSDQPATEASHRPSASHVAAPPSARSEPAPADAPSKAEQETREAQEPAERTPAEGAGSSDAGSRGRDRLVLPKATAEQAVQALAYGSAARRRSRATSRAAVAAFAAATDEAARSAEQSDAMPPQGERAQASETDTDGGPARDSNPHHGNGTSIEDTPEPGARTPRRTRKPKRQGLPEGWVIDEEGFVVPGAG